MQEPEEPDTISVAAAIGGLTQHPDFEEWYGEFMLFKKFVAHWRMVAQQRRLENEHLQQVNNRLIMKLGRQAVEYEAVAKCMREAHDELAHKYRLLAAYNKELERKLTLQQRTAPSQHSSE